MSAGANKIRGSEEVRDYCVELRQQIMELVALVPYNLIKTSITQGLPPPVQ